MSKKFKGFSLAELLISLLVISIVLSAAIPTITKRTAQDREQIWKWSTDNNGTYFGLGSNQAVLIGTPIMPTGNIAVFMDDDNDASTNNYEELYLDNPRFTTTGDKLSILKQSLEGHTTNMANSHISFYNIKSGAPRDAAHIIYAGRIATDEHNLAFGRGTLLHLNDISSSFWGENTAIGHYALMATTSGYKNVAVGEKTLTFNKTGTNNTALGYLAGNKIDSDSRKDNRTVNGITVDENAAGYSTSASDNVAIGAYSLKANETGYANTAVGTDALSSHIYGDDNTSIGAFSLGTMSQGYGNTSIGAGACSLLNSGNYNICIGNSVLGAKNNDNYSISIGSSVTPQNGADASKYSSDIQHSIPLITGHTQRVGSVKITASNEVSENNKGNFDKELIVNSKHVKFKPFAGGDVAAFTFTSAPGDMYLESNAGYGNGNNFKTPNMSAEAFFNLRYNKPDTPGNITDSVAIGFTAKPNLAVISSFNPTSVSIGEISSASYTNLVLNELLLTTPGDTTSGITPNASIRSKKTKVGLNSAVIDAENGNKNAYDIAINNKLNVSLDAAHTVNIDNAGTQIIDMGDNKSFDVVFNNDSDNPNLTVSKDFVALNSESSIHFQIAGADLMYVMGNDLNLKSGSDIKYESAINVGGTSYHSVREAIQHAATVPQQIQSDARLKNIAGDNTAGLAEINKIEVKNYTYKKDEKKTPHVGVIAQQLQKIFPNAVTKGDDGYLRIRTEDIFYAMVNSIKELCAKLQDLTAKVVGLDKRITELEAQNKMLQTIFKTHK